MNNQQVTTTDPMGAIEARSRCAMRHYEDSAIVEGQKQPDLAGPVEVFIDDRPLTHTVHHSPDGFQWGYGGSGPADLALSILAAVIDEPSTVKIYRGKVGATAWQLHQTFKVQFVAGFGDEWQMTVGQVRAWVRAQSEESK